MNFFKNIKNIILYSILFIIILGCFGVAFSTNQPLETRLIGVEKISSNSYIDTKKLNKIIVKYDTTGDISSYNLVSTCDSESKYIGNKNDSYYYSITFKSNCDNASAILKNHENKVMPRSYVKFNIISESILFDLYSDLNDEILSKYKEKLEVQINKQIDKTPIFANAKKQRYLNENKYRYRILNRIIDGRKLKYKIPVIGNKLPTRFTKVPNSPRPYRQNYTDGVHHGWDFDTNYGNDVVAIDDGVIIRIVDNFDNKNYENINKKEGLSEREKLINLDILRGNQVWIKTTKGDVAFYSHLSYIRDDLEVGYIISRGEKIGKVGTTGVPVDGYDDYHLHIPIHTNHHNTKMAGKHTFDEYMAWEWYFKGKSFEYILKHQGDIFEE